MKKIKNKKLKLIIVVILLIIVVIAAFNINTISQYITGEKRFFWASYSGTCGSSNWTINNSGLLTIQAGTLPNIDKQNRPGWYQYREYITSVQVNNGVNTSDICEGLFQDCTNLISANLTNLNTSNTTHLGYMFDGCTNLNSVTFGINVVKSSTIKINNMFQNCSSIEAVNLSNFNTTNITDMSNLFWGCTSLNSITWGSNFNTAKVTNFQGMFGKCNSLPSVDLSGFNTSQATNMIGMFLECQNIITLDLTSFNTSNVVAGNMNRMLEGMTKCNAIVLGSNFRFKKTNSSECQIFTTNDTIWQKDDTFPYGNSVLLFENESNPTGTWYRQYFITYHGNGGQWNDQPENSNYATYSKEYSIGAAVYTRNEYEFAGWTTNSDGTDDGNNWAAETVVWNYTVGQKGIKYASTIELYAMWRAKQYTIVYKGDGGVFNGSDTFTETVYYGELITIAKNKFSKKGHNFSGWKDPTGSVWTDWGGFWRYTNGQYGITNNTLTITAQWTPKVYTIKYQGNGGLWNDKKEWVNYATYGQSYTVVTNNNFYTRKGYNFNTWKDPTDTSWNPGSTYTWTYDNGQYGIENDTLILMAQWTPKVFNVNYLGNGGTWNGHTSWTDNVHPAFGDLYRVVPNTNFYVRSGYTHTGWNDPTGDWWYESWYEIWKYDIGDYGITSDTLNLYANWTPNNNCATVTVNHYTMDRYNYDTPGNQVTWSKNPAGAGDVEVMKVDKSVSRLFAEFRKKISGFVMYPAGGYINNSNPTQKPPTSEIITKAPISEDSTLNIYYRPAHLRLDINANGGTLAFDHKTDAGFDGDLILPDKNTPSYRYTIGMYGTEVGTVDEEYYKIFDTNKKGFPDVNDPNEINIKKLGYHPKENKEWYTVDINGKFVQEYSQLGTYDDSQAEVYNAIDVANAAGKDLSITDTYIEGRVNWEPNTYTITLNPSGGTMSVPNKTVSYDDKYGYIPVPQKDGYTFNGWSYLPGEYKQLEYIESKGSQYIDTGYTINQRTGIIADYQFTDLTQQQRLLGVDASTTDSSTLSYQYYINSANNWAYSYQNSEGNWVGTQYAVDTSRHTLKFNLLGNSLKYDNNDFIGVVGNVTQSPATDNYLYLFACDQYGTATGFSKVKIYGFSIYDDETLVHQYIPCQNPQGEIGLYDIVAGEFKGNSGTGIFGAGPVKFVSETDIVKQTTDHTLYAKWSSNPFTIEYYRGNADTAPSSGITILPTKLGESSVPPAHDNSYTLTTYGELNGTVPKGWRFAGWSEVNASDSKEVTYQDGQNISVFSSGRQENVEQNIFQFGDYVKYVNILGEEIICRVLYEHNSVYGQNGVQIIPINSTKTVELKGEDLCNIAKLNNVELSTLNYQVALGVRSVGSVPFNKAYCDWRDQPDNKNYRYDLERMNSLGITDIDTNYWLASEDEQEGFYDVYYIDSNGDVSLEELKANPSESSSKTYSYRPVYTLNTTIIIDSGDGTENNPYTIAGYSEIMQKGIIKLYAIFERDVKFNSGANGGTSSIVKQYFNPMDSQYISEVEAPQPSFEGMDNGTWNCIGYSRDTQFSNCEYKSNEKIKPQFSVLDKTNPSGTTLNLYAIYERYLTMAYDGNGATGGETTSHRSDIPQYYSADGSLTSYTFTTKSNGFTRTGYTFNKWAEDSASGTQVAQGANITFSPAINSSNTTKTMYALWNAITYSITYDLDGGTVATENPTSYTAETPTFTLNNPTKSCYTFTGWTGTGITSAQETVTISQGSSGDRSYTANWEPNTVVVTIKRNNQVWPDSGMKVGLYQNGVEKYSTTVSSGNTATFNLIESGEYHVYAGKNSDNKTNMVDTGEIITVGD